MPVVGESEREDSETAGGPVVVQAERHEDGKALDERHDRPGDPLPVGHVALDLLGEEGLVAAEAAGEDEARGADGDAEVRAPEGQELGRALDADQRGHAQRAVEGDGPAEGDRSGEEQGDGEKEASVGGHGLSRTHEGVRCRF